MLVLNYWLKLTTFLFLFFLSIVSVVSWLPEPTVRHISVNICVEIWNVTYVTHSLQTSIYRRAPFIQKFGILFVWTTTFPLLVWFRSETVAKPSFLKHMKELTFPGSSISFELPGLWNKVALENCSLPSFAIVEWLLLRWILKHVHSYRRGSVVEMVGCNFYRWQATQSPSFSWPYQP